MSCTSERWVNLKPQGANLEVEDFLSMRFANLSALLHRNITKQYLAKHDIGLPEWRVLTMLVRLGSVPTRELRQASGMDKGQMSRALSELEKRSCSNAMPTPITSFGRCCASPPPGLRSTAASCRTRGEARPPCLPI